MEKEISGKKRLVSFLHSDTFKVILCLFALLFVILDQAVLGTLIFVVITSLLLLPWGDGAVALLSFLLVCGISMRCYDSFDTFIVFWPLALLPIAVLIARLILGIRELKNKDSQRVGESFYPNLAVAISVTLGGLGSISLSDYFSPTALYYVFFLGFGMIVFYLIARVEIFKAKEEIFDAFAKVMYLFGVFCSLSVFHIYIANLPSIVENGLDFSFAQIFQWQNNAATMLFFCLPFPFYFSRKNCLHTISGFIMLISLFLTTSRSALLFSPLLFLVCVIYSFRYNKKNILVFFTCFALSLVGLLALRQLLVRVGAEEILETVRIDAEKIKVFFSFASGKDGRGKLILRSFEDFRSSPIFGKGLGYTGINDLYSPKKGAMHWYHMMIPQVIGSLGVVGILAYSYQIIVRTLLVFKKKTPYNLCLGISYLGILLMSQVNPGEFCPLPYELLTVLIFIILEKSIANHAKE